MSPNIQTLCQTLCQTWCQTLGQTLSQTLSQTLCQTFCQRSCRCACSAFPPLLMARHLVRSTILECIVRGPAAQYKRTSWGKRYPQGVPSQGPRGLDRRTGPGLSLDLGMSWQTWPGLSPNQQCYITIAWLGPLIANPGRDWTPKEHKGQHSNAACAKSGPRQAHVGPSGPDVGLTWGLTWPTWAGLPPSQGHVRAMSGPCRAFRH